MLAVQAVPDAEHGFTIDGATDGATLEAVEMPVRTGSALFCACCAIAARLA